jgi:tetratricopeptide (TPR) repeat protein
MDPSTTPDQKGKPLRLPLIIGATLLTLVAAGAAAWWFGPWSAPFRYGHTDLVSLRRKVAQNPKDYHAWREIGLRLAKDGDPLAYGALQEAYALNPNDVEVGTGLGELLMETRSYPEAFQVLKSVTSRVPKYTLGRMALGRLYRRKGSYQHAASEFEAVTAQDPKDSGAWYELAVCYLQMQRAAKSQEAITKALSLQPKDPQYLLLKGSIDTALGQIDSGIAATKSAADLAPKDVKVQSTFVNLLLAHHRGPEDLKLAGEVLGRLEQLSPNDPFLPYQRGELERLQQNWTAAATYLERAQTTIPGQIEVYFSLGQVYRRLGRNADADRVLAVYHKLQDLRRKIDDVRVAIGSSPRDVSLYAKLIDYQLQLGDREGAASSLQAAYDIDPKSPHIRKHVEAMKKMGVTFPTPGS